MFFNDQGIVDATYSRPIGTGWWMPDGTGAEANGYFKRITNPDEAGLVAAMAAEGDEDDTDWCWKLYYGNNYSGFSSGPIKPGRVYKYSVYAKNGDGKPKLRFRDNSSINPNLTAWTKLTYCWKYGQITGAAVPVDFDFSVKIEFGADSGKYAYFAHPKIEELEEGEMAGKNVVAA
jgi:hypothetical protein